MNKAWNEYGFGFSLDECDMESVANFLADKCGYESEKKELLTCDNSVDMEAIVDDQVSTVIASKINEETKTNIFSGFPADEADHGEMIGVGPCFPWQVHGVRYSKKECDEILKRYASELGAGKDLENDEFEMEYMS